jgi:hypothetical protein
MVNRSYVSSPQTPLVSLLIYGTFNVGGDLFSENEKRKEQKKEKK